MTTLKAFPFLYAQYIQFNVYHCQFPEGNPYAGIYRPAGGGNFKLIHKTKLSYTTTGNHTHILDCPWHVLQGDMIGFHTHKGNVSGISVCQQDINGYSKVCPRGSYYSRAVIPLLNYQLKVGDTYSVPENSLRIVSMRALFN